MKKKGYLGLVMLVSMLLVGFKGQRVFAEQYKTLNPFHIPGIENGLGEEDLNLFNLYNVVPSSHFGNSIIENAIQYDMEQPLRGLYVDRLDIYTPSRDLSYIYNIKDLKELNIGSAMGSAEGIDYTNITDLNFLKNQKQLESLNVCNLIVDKVILDLSALNELPKLKNINIFQDRGYAQGITLKKNIKSINIPSPVILSKQFEDVKIKINIYNGNGNEGYEIDDYEQGTLLSFDNLDPAIDKVEMSFNATSSDYTLSYNIGHMYIPINWVD